VKGARRALEAGVSHIEVVVSASETHNQKNVRRSVEESLAGVAQMAAEAGDRPVLGMVATAFGCPYEGDVAVARAVDVGERLLEAGCAAVGFGDTTGMATPLRVRHLLRAWTGPSPQLHFHNTRGTGLANVLSALEEGVTHLDASVGGLGGCPYAPGATGNICTEDLVHMLEDMGVRTGVDLGALQQALNASAAATHFTGRRTRAARKIMDPPSAHITIMPKNPLGITNVHANEISVNSRMISHRPRFQRKLESSAPFLRER